MRRKEERKSLVVTEFNAWSVRKKKKWSRIMRRKLTERVVNVFNYSCILMRLRYVWTSPFITFACWTRFWIERFLSRQVLHLHFSQLLLQNTVFKNCKKKKKDFRVKKISVRIWSNWCSLIPNVPKITKKGQNILQMRFAVLDREMCLSKP